MLPYTSGHICRPYNLSSLKYLQIKNTTRLSTPKGSAGAYCDLHQLMLSYRRCLTTRPCPHSTPTARTSCSTAQCTPSSSSAAKASRSSPRDTSPSNCPGEPSDSYHLIPKKNTDRKKRVSTERMSNKREWRRKTYWADPT